MKIQYHKNYIVTLDAFIEVFAASKDKKLFTRMLDKLILQVRKNEREECLKRVDKVDIGQSVMGIVNDTTDAIRNV